MNSIEQDIVKSLGKSKLPDHVATRLRSKLAFLRDRYGINFNLTVLGFEKNPDLYKQIDDMPGLSTFFRRHIDIWLDIDGRYDLVFSKNENDWVPAVRTPFRIALYNPDHRDYKDHQVTQKVESWSRIVSISKDRRDHYRDGGRPKKSRFDGNLSFIRSKEFSAFNNGIGLLVRPDVMRMYLEFEDSIGKSSNGVVQKFICLECVRVPRRRSTTAVNKKNVHGYKIEVHGYPVGTSDIDKDFSGIDLKLSDVPFMQAQCIQSPNSRKRR